MVQPRAVAGFACDTRMGIGSKFGSDIVMAFRTGIFTGIVKGCFSIFPDGIAPVMAIFPEGFRHEEIPCQQEEPDEKDEKWQESFDLWRHNIYIF